MTLKERTECKELVAQAKKLSTDDTSGGILIQGSRSPRADENNQNPSKIWDDEKNKKDALTILYTNADGLVNKIQELKALVNSFTDRLQVIAVTETFVTAKHLSQQLLISEFHLQGYNTFSQDLDDPNKRGLL